MLAMPFARVRRRACGARRATRWSASHDAGGVPVPHPVPGRFPDSYTQNVVCADLYARNAIGLSELSSWVNRVIPWCGVAPVGFFPSREAGGAGGGLQPGRDQPRPTGIWQGP